MAAAIFVVWHMAPDIEGVLPRVLGRSGPLEARPAQDREPVEHGRIYVAPPDHHLLIEPGRVRVTRGPKENHFRPAVDPLFRSAANSYGQRVIGVILSGSLDDGSAGLWTIKHHGGLAVVQDPLDSLFSSMPESAMREVSVDHVVPIAEMADLLVRLSQQPVPEREAALEVTAAVTRERTTMLLQVEKTALELGIAAGRRS